MRAGASALAPGPDDELAKEARRGVVDEIEGAEHRGVEDVPARVPDDVEEDLGAGPVSVYLM